MRLLRRLEAADALVHVPAKRADDAHVVIERHLAVCNDIETCFFLIVDDRLSRVMVGLFMLDFLECDANVTSKQLMFVPVWSGIRPDHSGW